MKQDLTLLIMAAGIGSRFGGLKQMEPVGPSGEFMIDYSIYDAIQAGFNKIVFVIKEENYDDFRKTIGNRIESFIRVEYCFQDLYAIPSGYEVPEGRIKPWGTAHAILSAKPLIHEKFAIINADDFYGREAFTVMHSFLSASNDENEYAIVGYKVKNTLTDNGSVKRGVLRTSGKMLTKLTESSIEEVNGEIIASPLNGAPSFRIEADTTVSMNMMGFHPNIFNYIEEYFSNFLDFNAGNMLACEYLIPDLVQKLVEENKIKVEIIPTDAKWQGVTYKEDVHKVVNMISSEIEKGIYKQNLWEK